MAAEAAISFAVELLGNLLIQKVNFLRGVEAQVRGLKDELKGMQCFLEDLSEKQATDERVRNWISEIREVAQDAQDAIEMFNLKVENPTRSRVMLEKCACFPAHVSHLNRVGEEIESIRKRLEAIDQNRKRYRIQDLGERELDPTTRRSLENVERRRRLAPWEKDEDVVGLEKNVQTLLDKSILEEKEKKKGLSIAAIVGMGGIGKSTLAKKIYNHAAVAAEFESRAWVVVSSKFTPEDVMKQIVLQLQISQDDRDWLKDVESIKDNLRREAMLQQMLHKQLEGKRYFIVLDDVWEHTHWESLRSAFPNEQDKTSRLLLTSRNNFITKHAQYVHKMKLLSPGKRWELFSKKAFINNTDGRCPNELEYIGRKILEKCGGLPLAISVVGGLLAEQRQSKSGWERVMKEMRSPLDRSGSNDISTISAILELSYQNLPPQLKSCFLCLAFFKEDATIHAQRLVHIWVAQGFVQQRGEERVEEIARGYLDELINRNLVQVKDLHIDGRVKNFHVHDLLRDLSIKKANEEIGFEIPREEGSSSKYSYTPRHHVVHCGEDRRFIYPSNQNKHLRSLFVHVDPYKHHYIYDVSYNWKSCELLKILDIEGIAFSRLSHSFRALIGLRYLRLKDAILLKLPSWLDRLKNLEVLDLDNVAVKLPNATLKMDSLRHFYADCIFGPVKVDTWKNLETLKYVRLKNWRPDNSTQMASCRLRKLGIIFLNFSEISWLSTSLEKLQNLVQLHLRWEYDSISLTISPAEMFQAILLLHHLTKLKLEGPMTQFPAASMFPQNLTHLIFSRTYIQHEDPMPVLGKLPKLLSLKLKNGAYDGESMKVLPDAFPGLKFLSFQGMHRLKQVYIETGGMPELERWEINHCRNLIENSISLPEHLRSDAITIID